MNELPLAFHKHGLEVIVRIAAFVSRRPVADFEIHDFFGCFVYQAVAITSTCFEARAHSWRKLASTFVCVQSGPTFKYVDELVLFCMSMAKSRHGIWSQASEVHSEVLEFEDFAELPLFSSSHT